jgi:hypothetical protein
MKAPSLVAFACTLGLFIAPELHAQGNVQQLLTEAQQSYMKGDLERANQQFQTVNEIDPKYPSSIGLLRRIQLDLARYSFNSMEKLLEKVVIAKVEFKEATLGSALDYLKQVVSRTTEGKQSVNFIVQLPDEQVKTQTVTMSVTNMPFTEVLRYLGGLANLQFEYEKYAVVVKPKGATAAATAAGQPTAQ